MIRRPPNSFKNKVVVITGGASGIGRALGCAFARRGARIALLDLDGDGAAEVASSIKDADQVETIGLACDVTNEVACQLAIEAVLERFGGIDVLVNNAGITQRDAFTNTSLQALRTVMEVNFFGAVTCTKHALDSLVKRRGTIIVTSSIAGLAPLLGRASYCASKHALHGLFGTLRAELRDQGVHVLIVCPSFVRTNLQTRALDGDGDVTRHPQSTVGTIETPERVAEKICEAASRRQSLLVMSPVGKLSRWLNALVPDVYERLMTRQVKRELER